MIPKYVIINVYIHYITQAFCLDAIVIHPKALTLTIIMETLVLLLILLAVVWFFLDGARAREMALAVADETCKQRAYQLLEDSAQLKSIRLKRTNNGLRLLRIFQFEYSDNNVSRRYGSVAILGKKIEHVVLDKL